LLSHRFCGFTSIFFATLALLFGVYSVFSCNAVEFPQKDADGAISAGLYGYRTKSYTFVNQGDSTEVWVSGVCVSYDNLKTETFLFTFDKTTEALQILAIILTIIAFIFALCSCIVPCVPKVHPLAWKGLGIMFIVCCILQGCALLILDSSICLDNPVIQYLTEYSPVILATLQDPDDCDTAPGIKFGISAVAFWFVAGAIPLLVPPPSFDEEAVAAKPEVEAAVEAKDQEEHIQDQPSV
jgi:hypothetical protein